MRVFAYCAEPFRESARRAAGVLPVTSPPIVAATFNPQLLADKDFIYFDLHGLPGASEWLNDERKPALTVEHFRQVNINGAVVFATNCYLADKDSPMLDALLAAGARYVIAGDGENFAGTNRAQWAALLGRWMRILIGLGADPLRSLAIAKQRVRLSPNRRATNDTLMFKAFKRDNA